MITTTSTARAKLTRARAALILDHPFYGSLALRLRLEESGAVQTAGVDGVVLAYNPAFIDRLTDPECRFLVAHEVLHCALAHMTRRAGRDPGRWNAAGDYVINEVLTKAGIGAMPQGGLLDSQFNGLSTDEVYARLPDDPPSGESATGTVEDAPDPSQGSGSGGAGGGANGQPMPSPTQLEGQWKIATAQAAQLEARAGHLPGELQRIVDAILHPRVDWREMLRRYMVPTKDDYTWSRPNRRHLWRGLYLPSMRDESVADVVMAIDTSGSVDDAQLQAFAGEAGAILAEFPRVTLTVIYCDSAMRGHEVFTYEDLPLKLNAAGGGGTRFSPVFDWIAAQGLNPACLVYLTDLAIGEPWPSASEYPVLWVSTGAESAPWGEVTRITL